MQIRPVASIFLRWLPLASLLLGPPSPWGVAASGEVTNGDLLLSIHCHDLAQIDDCVTRISRQLEIPIPSPLSLLNTITGTDSGIAPSGNLCLQLLSGPALSAEPRLCLQLPVTDFDRFATTLGGNPANRLTTLQLAGQKLAAGRRGRMVLLMDETDRPILQKLIGQDLSPEDEAQWQAWSKDQNLVIRLTRLGLELIADRARIQFATNNLNYDADTIVELDHRTDSIDRPATRWYPVWDMLKEFIKQYPGTGLLLPHAESLALGLRVHNEADLSVELRLRWHDDSRFASISAGDISAGDISGVDAVNRFQTGPFIFLGSGLLQPAVTSPLVRSYTLHQLASLADYGNDKYQRDDVEKLVDDIEAVLDDTRVLSVIQRKTGRDEGVYGNTFLLLHTENADQVRNKIAKAFMSWNWLMDHAEGDICLQFKSTPISIAEKPATEYTADMLKAVDARPLPEVKDAMKALFGPGGLYRIQLVPVDDQTVLLGNATVTQTKILLAELGTDGPRLFESAEIKSLKTLFNRTPHFEFYIDPRELTSHQERTQKAELGEVLGGPLHRQFPDTPPFGVALRFDPGELHAALALTDKTLSGLVKYLKHEP